MIVCGWHVERFGPLADLRVEGLPPGLVVVYGPNEAGKSSLLAFVRFVLFGAGRSREPRLARASGGRLFLGRREEIWTVERVAGRREPQILGPNGAPVPPEALGELLAGVDAQLYHNVFAFGLAELMQLETLTEARVRDQIFSAGITGAGGTASRARRRLVAAAEALVKPRATSTRVQMLLREWREAKERLAAAEEQVEAYADLVRREEEARLLAQSLGERAEALRAEERELATLLELWEPWNDWQTAKRALAELAPPKVDAEIARRMAEVRRDREEAMRRCRELDELLEQQVAERARLVLHPELEALAEKVAAVAAEASAQRGRLREVEVAESDLGATQHALAASLARLGPQWTAERMRQVDASLAARDVVRQRLKELEARSLDVQAAVTRVEDAREDKAEREAALASARLWAERLAGHPTTEELEARREALAQAERRQVYLRQQVTTAAVASACAVVLAVLGVSLTQVSEVVRAMSLVLAAGLAALAARGPARGWLELRRVQRATLAELALPFSASAADFERARAAIQAGFGRAKERQQAEDAERRAQEDLREAEERLSRREEALRKAEDALAEERERLAALLAALGLPRQVAPEDVLAYLDEFDKAKALQVKLEAGSEALARVRTDCDAWQAEAERLLQAAGRELSADPRVLVHHLEALAKDVEEAVRLREQVEALSRHIEGLERRREEALAVLRAAEEEHERLLAMAAAADDRAFDQLVAEAEAWREAQARVERAYVAVARALGSGAYGERLQRRLEQEGKAEWQERLARLERELEEVQTERDRAIEARRDAESRRREVEQSADVAAYALKEAELRQELREAVSLWKRYELAAWLLDRALGVYLEERQPEVLSVASSAFASVTAGRYRRVVQEGEDEGGLLVVDDQGRRWNPTLLSQGTREQLYLCLRLGLAELFARRAAPLPMVLDDVLVNSDPRRARLLLTAFATYLAAEERQILLFTCHPETVALAKAAVPDCRVLELPAPHLASANAQGGGYEEGGAV